MSAAELLVNPVPSTPSGPAHPPARPMWWMYLLVALALAAMGSGAVQALFVTRDLGSIASVLDCLAGHGGAVPTATLDAREPVDPAFVACAAPFNRRHGVAMLVGAGAGPAAAWLLMLGGGLAMRWRLRRRAPATAATAAATTRFEVWCDQAGLRGRRRPVLSFADVGGSTRQAFTTGLPFARAVVVIPVGYAYTAPAQFDAVVLHELAHVRARDLTWASSVWWAGWLSVPALVMAISSGLSWPRPVLHAYGSALWLAVAMSVAVLVLRAGLLRRRELAADRYVVDVLGNADALRAALGAGSEVDRTGLSGLIASSLRLIAAHPTLRVRLAADVRLVDSWEGGFAVTAATGLVAMFGYQSIANVFTDFTDPLADPRLYQDAAYALAALLWAAVVVPAWTRRVAAAARTGSTSTWWGPLTGAVVGLVVGYCLQIPGASTAVGTVLFADHLPLLVLTVSIVACEVSIFAAGVGSRAGGLSATILGVLVAALTLTVALSAAVTVAAAQVRFGVPPTTGSC